MTIDSCPPSANLPTAGGFEVLHHHEDRIGGFSLSLERAIDTSTWTVELDALTTLLQVAAQRGLSPQP